MLSNALPGQGSGMASALKGNSMPVSFHESAMHYFPLSFIIFNIHLT